MTPLSPVIEIGPRSRRLLLPVRNYNLDATLQSGQAFGWHRASQAWEGVIGLHWVRLQTRPEGLQAETAEPVRDWSWLTHYLQTEVDLESIVATFPPDAPMQNSVEACSGLRLLRQDPWECLACFILSACKQISQIRQIVATLCQRFGQPLPAPPGSLPAFVFPQAARLASCTETELRECKMGWRAAALRETSRLVARGSIALSQLHRQPLPEAREALLQLPGVGPKIANCVLLFACGFQEAFPVDVWIQKALRHLYFPKRCPTPARLHHFTTNHFGPYAGYAQQYLFHYMRTQAGR